MKSTALRPVCTTNFSVALENVSLAPISVTMTVIVKMAVMNIIATMRPAVVTSSPAPAVTAFTRTGFAMDRMTVQTLEMKMDVKATIVTICVTRESGLAHTLDSASPFIKFVMGFQIVPEEKMKIVLLVEVLVVPVCALS